MSTLRFTRAAHKTVLFQVASILMAQVCGSGVIWALISWANSWGVTQASGESFQFGVLGWIFGALGLLSLALLMTYKQHHQALDSRAAFVKSLIWAAGGGTFLMGVLALLALIDPPTSEIMWGAFLFMVLLTLSVGGIVGLTLAVRLKVEAFDKATHPWLSTDEATLTAAKAGELPYRYRINQLWVSMMLLLGALVFIAAGVALFLNGADGFVIILVALGLLALGISLGVMAAIMGTSLINVRVDAVDAVVTAKEIATDSKGQPMHYLIYLHEDAFATDERSYPHITPEAPYRFYTLYNDIVAYEPLDNPAIEEDTHDE